MHQALVFCGYRHKQFFERILVFALHRQDTAEVNMVVLPKDHVLCVLETMEHWLHGDDRQRSSMRMSYATALVRSDWPLALYAHTFACFIFPALPYLLLWIALTYDGVLFTIHT